MKFIQGGKTLQFLVNSFIFLEDIEFQGLTELS